MLFNKRIVFILKKKQDFYITILNKEVLIKSWNLSLHFVTALVKQTTKHFVTTVTETNSTTHENHFQNTSALTGSITLLENCILKQFDLKS